MMEMEWLQRSKPSEMLDVLGKRATGRKLRLFAVACVLQNWEQSTHPRLRHVIRVAERQADSRANEEEKLQALNSLDDYMDEFCEHDVTPSVPPCLLAEPFFAKDASAVACCIAETVQYQHDGSDGMESEIEYEQCGFLRDIFGNPFRPVTFDPRWATSDVLGLARAIYEDRAFDRMPILADALMDAGCAYEQVLGHCRGPGPHVRGCWVVDLVLGKE
jgi:hypothetical protein